MSTTEKTILGFRFAVIPFIVMPLTLLMIPFGYGFVPSAVYYAAHLVLDETLTGKKFWNHRISPRFANLWFYSFFVQELIAFLLLAMVINSTLFPSLREAIASMYAGFGYEVLGANPGFNKINAAVGAIAFIITINYTVTHVLVHQVRRFNWYLGYAILVTNCDSQFAISHIYGHHRVVGTSADVNTAQKGESFYRYLLRVIPGQYAQAYQYEKKRAASIPMPFALFYNRVTLGVFLSGAWLLAIFHFVGSDAVIAFVIANVLAKIGVETVDYIQHYGLHRADGEKIGDHHSWDGDSFASSIMMFNQNSHALHHVRPGLPYYELTPMVNAPKLPYGYLVMALMVLVPPLWFRKMNPLVEAWSAKFRPEQVDTDVEFPSAVAV